MISSFRALVALLLVACGALAWTSEWMRRCYAVFEDSGMYTAQSSDQAPPGESELLYLLTLGGLVMYIAYMSAFFYILRVKRTPEMETKEATQEEEALLDSGENQDYGTVLSGGRRDESVVPCAEWHRRPPGPEMAR